jgi:hypothetical protein
MYGILLLLGRASGLAFSKRSHYKEARLAAIPFFTTAGGAIT